MDIVSKEAKNQLHWTCDSYTANSWLRCRCIIFTNFLVCILIVLLMIWVILQPLKQRLISLSNAEFSMNGCSAISKVLPDSITNDLDNAVDLVVSMPLESDSSLSSRRTKVKGWLYICHVLNIHDTSFLVGWSCAISLFTSVTAALKLSILPMLAGTLKDLSSLLRKHHAWIMALQVISNLVIPMNRHEETI